MSMLSISADKYTQTLDFSEALSFGAEVVIIGMVAIFAVLGLLWAILTLFKFVFAPGSSNKSEKSAAIAPIPTQLVAATDAEIVAVIAAAIAMAESESDNGMKFRVVSFRRK